MRSKISGDINYKERLDSCQKEMALMEGKREIFQPLMLQSQWHSLETRVVFMEQQHTQ